MNPKETSLDSAQSKPTGYVDYVGLLNEAHERGLSSIKTEVVMFPTPEFPVAIVQAQVSTSDGTFTGIGDACAENVDPAIAPHYIRMAETRAKARALRDALNIGIAAIEELGTNGGFVASKKGDGGPNGKNGRKMSQADYIALLCRTKEVDSDLESDIRSLWEKKDSDGNLPKIEASAVIERLKQCSKKKKSIA